MRLGVQVCVAVSTGVNVWGIDGYSSESLGPLRLLGACAREHACVRTSKARVHACTCMCAQGPGFEGFPFSLPARWGD